MKQLLLAAIVAILFALFVAALADACPAGEAAAKPAPAPSPQELEAQRKRDERRQFQDQELMTARPNTCIFNPGDPPRIIWRDVDAVRRLGCDGALRVRWFDYKLNEAAMPSEPGRWGAWIEGTAPNGTPVHRGLTFYARGKDFLFFFVPDLAVRLPQFPGPIAAEVWREHEAETTQLAGELLLRGLNDSQAGAVLLAGLVESKPLGRPAGPLDTAAARNEEYHLALKLKVQGLQNRVRPIEPPRRRTKPAPVLHPGTPAAADMQDDAKAKIDAVCRDWACDSGEPFVTLVARHGVIVTHEAFGQDNRGCPIGHDYRCWVASITKTVTALLFSRFLDQGLAGLDDSLAAVFPDYPKNDPHVPTFRQCFNHTSGLAGMGDFGGVRNPYLENVVLNGIDVNRPNVKYEYSGMGFELAGKAMEIIAGKTAPRLYNEDLFRPLGFGDVPMGNASSDGHFTAMELGVLAQWIANRGSYGDLEFISACTFEKLLPEPLDVPDRGFVEDEGIGMHWIRHFKPGAKPTSKLPEDQLFSLRTVGHGSFSGCIFMIDLERQLVVTQVRKEGGPRSGEWSGKFFRTVAEMMK